MNLLLKTGLITVLLLVCIGAASAASFDNGGFENPHVINPLGWDIYQDGTLFLVWDVQWVNDGTAAAAQTAGVTIANAEFQNAGAISITPAEGDQYAELDTDWDGPGGSINNEPANVIISQTFDTNPGAVYHISYYQRCRNSQCDLQFDWTGDSPVTTTGDLTAWKPIGFDRTASGSETTISFTGLGTPDSYGALLDGVVVTQTTFPPPVPEFPTIALPAGLIIGLLGAVLFIKRTKEN